MSITQAAINTTLHPFNAETLDFSSVTEPRLFYLICSTPRCGSTYLAREMWLTGCMGAPHEYFNYDTVLLQLSARLGARNMTDYTDRLLRARTGPNGIFGMKLHLDHFRFFYEFSGQYGRFAPIKFIWMDRTGLVEQAVSHVMAKQTGVWTAAHDEVGKAEYKPSSIERSVRVIKNMQAAWAGFFKKSGNRPYRVNYEDFCSRPAEIIGEIADFLGVELSHGSRIGNLPPVERQSDETKVEWAARFRAG